MLYIIFFYNCETQGLQTRQQKTQEKDFIFGFLLTVSNTEVKLQTHICVRVQSTSRKLCYSRKLAFTFLFKQAAWVNISNSLCPSARVRSAVLRVTHSPGGFNLTKLHSKGSALILPSRPPCLNKNLKRVISLDLALTWLCWWFRHSVGSIWGTLERHGITFTPQANSQTGEAAVATDKVVNCFFTNTPEWQKHSCHLSCWIMFPHYSPYHWSHRRAGHRTVRGFSPMLVLPNVQRQHSPSKAASNNT